MHVFEGLNEAQKDAVAHLHGPLLILAGAGSGKTRVITHRIVNLIQNGVHPKNILAVTFTNKAAGEMRERVTRAIRENNTSVNNSLGGGTPTVATFHSLGVRILREHHEILNLSKYFTIYDRSDTLRAVKRATEKAGHDLKEFDPKKTLGAISKAKGDAVTRADFIHNSKSFGSRMIGEIWNAYEDILVADGALDFDDLLVKTRNLLVSNPDILAEYRDRYTHVHIDEFQDTNGIQMETAKLLGGHGNICAVGDLDQSIYGWRGAKTQNILNFERHFPGCVTIFLEENYRSTKNIIEASNAIIEHNTNRPPKTAFTNNTTGDPISLHVAITGIDEAYHIARTTETLIKNGVNPSRIAVLYRTNSQSRIIEEAMLKVGVPYQLLGTKFFERKEVKDVLSYLRYALSGENAADLTRIINTPSRGIGAVSQEKIFSGQENELTGRAAAAYAEFKKSIQIIRDAIAVGGTVSHILRTIIDEIRFERVFKEDADGDERFANVQELVSLAVKYDHLETDEAVATLLEEAALQSDQDELGTESEQKDAVRVMTVHASKGLEFSHVCIAGMEEGLFPHQSFDESRARDIEEERRLFYVAVTRAEKKVYLSYAQSRIIFGSQSFGNPSSFLGEIPSHLLETTHGSGSGSGTRAKGLLDDEPEYTIWL